MNSSKARNAKKKLENLMSLWELEENYKGAPGDDLLTVEFENPK